MSELSVKSRFKFSFLSNGLRGLVVLLTSIVLARELGPDDFGALTFLLASFMALRVLMDLGSEKAFYTFLSQKPRGKQFFITYFTWQALQFFLPLLILILLPENWVQLFWLHEDRIVILLAFIATFMKLNAWQTLIYIAESLRFTKRIQVWSLAVPGVHLIILSILCWASLLSLPMVLGFTIVEYLVALGLVLKIYEIELPLEASFDGRKLLSEYKNYCAPLAAVSVVSFGSVFAERWMLQNFGGSVEQAFLGVCEILAAGVLLASTSLYNIFWKEIAEANAQKNREKLKDTYQKSTKFIFFIAASFSGFLMPWHKEIVSWLYGSAYLESAPVLAVMLIPPVFASLGNNSEAFLLATGQTKAYLKLRSFFRVLSIPASYFFLASKNAIIPGLDLGARGMAIKMVLFSIMSSSTIHWWIAKKYQWKWEWGFQLVTVGIMLFVGQILYKIAAGIGFIFEENIFLKAGFYFLLYFGVVGALLWKAPGLAGLSQQEIKSEVTKLKRLVVKQ